MRLALIVGRKTENNHREVYFSYPERLSTMLSLKGYLPVSIGYEVGEPHEIVTRLSPSVCIMTGGDSLGENPTRDDFEYRFLSSASENQVPIIGICRGMQLMASSKGVSVTSTHSHAGTTHEVFGENDFTVNSYHNFCLRSSPEGFSIDYTATDGSIEAFSNRALNWYGVMWHPEREEIDTPGYNHLLDILEKL